MKTDASGRNRLKKKDLIELKNPQGLFNRFVEVLKRHGISDTANAFNKMLNLLLCKIVDEEEKGEEDELDFQVRENEGYEELVDRLLRLYRKGVTRYFNENYVYYPDEEVEKLAKLYPSEKFLQMFKEMKYYKNDVFAFKEVHSKRLFDENAEVLTEVVKLLRPYRFKYSHRHQLLGDFFELLLGFKTKQSEGQFFTPMPIVSFINGSLKIEDVINSKLKTEEYSDRPLPKFLDYACGAGHFITDVMDKINAEIRKNRTLREFVKENPDWQREFIFGIEKDRRLARASKLACLLAGGGEAVIIHGDGLDEHRELNLDVEKVDVISANPPYSIRNFKRYLDVNVDYELLPYLSEDSKEIEVLFVERAKQVLKEGTGRMGIVLPASILSSSGVYEKARELLLKHFEIKAIVELGSNAFMDTGANTVVLFLKRRRDDFVKERQKVAEAIFSGEYFKEGRRALDGKRLLDTFIEYRGLPEDDYYRFVLEGELTEELLSTDAFKSYRDEFPVSRIKDKEKEKFLYFTLTFYDGEDLGDTKSYEFQNVFVVKAPEGMEEGKRFLGYEFSRRRGYEGIILHRSEEGKLLTMLYDEENPDNPEKISAYVRKSFDDETLEVHEDVKPYARWVKLPDLMDFNKAIFDKAISLNPIGFESLKRNYNNQTYGVADRYVPQRTQEDKGLKDSRKQGVPSQAPHRLHGRAYRP